MGTVVISPPSFIEDLLCVVNVCLYSDLRATLSGKDLPEDVKQRLLAMHEENLNLKESYKSATEKLTKAKQVGFGSFCVPVCLLIIYGM